MVHGRNNKFHQCETVNSKRVYKEKDFSPFLDKFSKVCLSCVKTSCVRGECELTKRGVV